jgi:plastocyanin
MRIGIVALLILAACGGSSSSSGGPVQVTLTAGGVSPASVNVGNAGSVKFTNNDAAAHQIASTSCPELASSSIAAGMSVTAQLGSGPKTCTYDDGLNPSAAAFQGTINVASPGMPGY